MKSSTPPKQYSEAKYKALRLRLEKMVEERASQLKAANTQLEAEAAVRKQIQEELRESSKRYRELVKYAPAAIYEVDFRTRRFLSVNDAMCEMSGYTREELLDMDPFDLLEPESQVLFQRRIRDYLSGRQPEESVEYKVITRDGRQLYALLNVSFTRSSVGTPIGATVVGHDITERKRAEELLQHERDLLQAVMDGAKNSHLVYLDRDFNFVRVNQPYADTCGYRPEEMIGKNYFALYPSVQNEAIFTRVRDTGEPAEFRDKPFEFPDQPERGMTYWDWTLTPVKVNGTVEGLIFSLFDTTERKKNEEASHQNAARLQQTNELLEIVTKGSGVIMAAVDTGYHYTAFNRAYLEEVKRLSGVEIAVGMNMLDVFAGLSDQQKIVREEWSRPLAGESTNKILEFGDPGNHRRSYNVLHTPIKDGNGHVVGAGEVAFDITEQVQRENELKHLNRTLRALININQSMIRSTDEASYMDDVCRIVVEDCGHPMVWIGLTRQDEAKSVQPVAFAGFDDGYIQGLNITWADTERGRGPTGTAIRTGQVNICRNVLTDPNFRPWRELAAERGYISSIALPLMNGQQAFGVLTICTREHGALSENEVALLTELANDLAFGIMAIRSRIAHEQTMKDLQQSEARYRALFNKMTEGFALHEIICDQQGKPVDYRFLDINPAFEQLTGLKQEQVIGKTYNQVLPGDDPRWVKEYGAVALTGQEVHFENYSPALKRFYSVYAYRPAEGQFAVILKDITEQKEMEQALRVNLAKYTTLFESFPLGITVSDSEGKILETNREAGKLLGIPEEEHLHRTIDSSQWQIIRPDGSLFPSNEYASMRALKEKRRIENQEMGIVKTNGQVTWISVTAAPLPVAGHGVVVTYGDITKRKRAEQSLARSNERLALLSEAASQLLASPEPQLVVEELCRKVLAHLDCQVFFNYLVDKTTGRLRLNACTGIPKKTARIVEWLDLNDAARGAVEQAGAPITIENIQETSHPGADLVRSFGVQAYACHPLMVQGKFIGTLSFGTKKRTTFSEDDLSLMKLISDSVATAIGRQHSEEALLQTRNELELRVQERTRELNQSNERLRLEISERQRLADNLHDAVNQSLFSAGLISEVLPRLWERDQAEARSSLLDLRKLTRSAQGEMRVLLAELRPSIVTTNNLDYLIGQLSDAFTGRTNLPVSVEVNGETLLPPEVQTVFYRICQEALNNIAKHASASHVGVTFRNRIGKTTLRIRDDGRGFDIHQPAGRRYGLTMMRERAESIGAILTISSRPGHGTQLLLSWKNPAGTTEK